MLMHPRTSSAVELQEQTIEGLHDFLMATVLSRYAVQGGQAIDLGAGSGALALRLQMLGLDVVAVDINVEGFKAEVPLMPLSLNEADFASQLRGPFDLVTAVEVIEHLESPVGFLRNVRRLLKPSGVAVITTPNVDNAPARLKFFLYGILRLMDERGDRTHISPIFWDLLTRQYLPRAGLNLVEHHAYPPRGYKATRSHYVWALRILAGLLSGDTLFGDNHVLVLQPGT